MVIIQQNCLSFTFTTDPQIDERFFNQAIRSDRLAHISAFVCLLFPKYIMRINSYSRFVIENDINLILSLIRKVHIGTYRRNISKQQSPATHIDSTFW